MKKRGAPATKRGAPAVTTTVVVDDKYQICKPPPQELTNNSQSLTVDGVSDSTPITVSALMILSVSTFWDCEGTVTINDQKWFLVHDSAQLEIPMNGRQGCTTTYWRMEDQYNGSIYAPGCDKRDEKLIPYDVFLLCFPKQQLEHMVENTNAKIHCEPNNHDLLTKSELLKFFGI